VQDLLSLAKALLVPEDDLALAEVLRSPVFALSEAALEALARHRTGSLRNALRESRLEAVQGFADWLEARTRDAHSMPPFAFLSSLLSAPAPTRPERSLRAVFAAALGSEIHDPLNALLQEALAYEQEKPQALLPFILAQSGRKTQLKRDAENAQDKVRVMTVHGAKGLEGRIVFLGDAHGKPEGNKAPKVIVLKDHHGTVYPVWSALPGAQEPEPAQARRAEMRETLMGEYRRLLYVGMTRAADRLYVVSHTKAPGKTTEIDKGQELPDPENPLEASWYQMLRRALVRAEPYGEGETLHENLPARFKRRIVSQVPPAPPCDAASAPAVETPLHAWLRQLLPPEKPLETTTPSSGAYAGAEGETTPFARRRGIVLHKLFELLPRVAPAAREATGLRLLPLIAPELASGEHAAFLAPVLAVLNGPIGVRHFGPDSRAEVSISGEVTLSCGAVRTVPGRIDRLRVDDTRVEILDLKTGKPHAAVEDAGILQQMALYRALLAQLYPNREILCQILWLESSTVENLPDSVLDAAFAALKPA
jgi:ATP-dependent helicase/nuclease subunit A